MLEEKKPEVNTMYILNTKGGTFWVRLSPEKEGWFGLGKDEVWIGSYPTLETSVKELNRLSNTRFVWDELVEESDTLNVITEMVA